MRIARVTLTLILTAIATSASAGDQPKRASGTSVITFSVTSASTDKSLPAVNVVLVSKDRGIVQIGQTDDLGQVSLDREVLSKSENLALLFCKDHFFCGAFRLDSPSFLQADRRLIDLAPFSIE